MAVAAGVPRVGRLRRNPLECAHPPPLKLRRGKPKRGAAMMRAFYGIVVGTLLFLAGSIVVSAQAQGGAAPQQPGGFTNLQVWPKDTSRAVIMQFMNAFGDSLGITCDYCH